MIIAQWANECILLSVLSLARVQFPAVAQYLMGLSLADHMHVLPWTQVLEDQRIPPQLKQWLRVLKNAFNLMLIMVR